MDALQDRAVDRRERMSCVNRALIVGGGIAGLTAAIALARKGIDCEVVEITESGEPVGAAITITGPAVDTLATVGVLEACKHLGQVNPLTTQSFDATGKSIGAAHVGGGQTQTAVGMYRPVLSELLRQQARQQQTRLRLGVGLRALTQRPHSVLVAFTDGSSGEYDLVVGADGIRSQVRQWVFGEHIRPEYAGQTSVRWMAEGPPIEGPAMMYYAPHVKVLGYALPRQNLIYLSTVSDRAQAIEHVTDEEARTMLAEQLACFTAPYVVAMAKRLTPKSKVIVRPFEWLLVPDPWYRQRIVLIGDAAHAMTAHLASGGGMAMEDGVVLADCIAAAESLPSGLDAFMRRRFARVQLVVDASVGISKLERERAPPNVLQARTRAALRQIATPY
jgi:2-polyprenyl-6-methoxyphenol hydroxylase-like FAD-dependent oxidoreductase